MWPLFHVGASGVPIIGVIFVVRITDAFIVILAVFGLSVYINFGIVVILIRSPLFFLAAFPSPSFRPTFIDLIFVYGESFRLTNRISLLSISPEAEAALCL
jgi:hypothetical protein